MCDWQGKRLSQALQLLAATNDDIEFDQEIPLGGRHDGIALKYVPETMGASSLTVNFVALSVEDLAGVPFEDFSAPGKKDAQRWVIPKEGQAYVKSRPIPKSVVPFSIKVCFPSLVGAVENRSFKFWARFGGTEVIFRTEVFVAGVRVAEKLVPVSYPKKECSESRR